MNVWSDRFRLWGFAWMLATAVSCGGGSDAAGPRPAATLNLSVPVDSLYVGEVLQAAISARDASGAALKVGAWEATWSTSAPNVATVSQRGIITAVGLGLTSISATVEGHAAEVTIRVVATPVALVSLTPVSVVLPPGATRQLTALPLDAAGRQLDGRTVSWLSSDTSVVHVSTTGVVTAIAPGITSVHAISEKSYASADVRVSGPPGAVTKITLVPAAASLTIGETLLMRTILEDAIGNIASDRPTAWSSSAPAVATVSASGLVTGLKVGTAVITVGSEQARGSASITVHDPADAITVSFADPDSTDVVSDTLSIYAKGKSRNPIVRARAIVANKEGDLQEIRVG
ncbi:MAG: Ig-like domain-containing protein, partial [Gemmatimonadota bacterium]